MQRAFAILMSILSLCLHDQAMAAKSTGLLELLASATGNYIRLADGCNKQWIITLAETTSAVEAKGDDPEAFIELVQFYRRGPKGCDLEYFEWFQQFQHHVFEDYKSK